jgi:subtilisin family serine protease
VKSRLPTLRHLAALAFGAAAAACAFAQPATHHFHSEPIPHRYIVTFRDTVADPVAESDRLVRGLGGQRHHAYRNALKGFAATLSDAAIERLRSNPDVVAIEQDQTVSIDAVEDQATWGIDRIDQVDRPLDTQYHYNYTGAGVYAFIIDTGIRADHVEFGGRVVSGYTAISDGNGTNDCNGHGTHVSGTVGGATYGVAKQVTLVPVRVLGCTGSGSWSGVIAGIDWAAGSTLRPAVANMSLGGSLSTSINAAVARAVAHGITMVVAAGNDNGDACIKSPASEPTAITVGALTSTDTRASFSNYGTCVDIFAPGVGITSSWNTSSTATNSISGTSMATPHVTGVAALALSANMAASPAAVTQFILANGTPNRVTTPGTGSPNLIVYSTAAGVPTEPPPVMVAIRSLSGLGVRSGSRHWRAQVTVTVYDLTTGLNVAGATVTGRFSPGTPASCVTTSSGNCTLSSLTLTNAQLSTVFTVTDTSGFTMIYDATQNSASQITIYRR